ncbi:MAG: DegT/DnrJ/EryC1/StrS family aminotransferase, partial [Syntrophorhabdaceae bacterium]|nr:DegT/DnrJ/EryC1/StrS family aminotransferase [Syntrophorhabdaceae bacterium]
YVLRTRYRDGLQTFLREKGIQTGIYYPVPLHMQGCFQYLGYREGSFPVSEEAAKRNLAIPVFPELKKAEKEYIVEMIRLYFHEMTA